jgi:hypothetical protein
LFPAFRAVLGVEASLIDVLLVFKPVTFAVELE